MFHSLYQQTQQATQAVSLRPWPATYLDQLVEIAPMAWQLTVDGLIEGNSSKTFSYQELLALQPVVSSQERRLISAEGWSYKGQFEGILLAALVNAVKPSPEAQYVIQTNASGHQTSLPLTQAIQEKTMFCHQVDGQPLSALYGGPVRFLVFHRYCYKGLSQLTKLTFSAEPLEPAQDFWLRKGYALEGNVSPGDYYAFDLGAFRPIREPEHVH